MIAANTAQSLSPSARPATEKAFLRVIDTPQGAATEPRPETYQAPAQPLSAQPAAPEVPGRALPSLRPRQRVLERRLRAKAHHCYRGMSWMQRTLAMCREWDLARKRWEGCLNTYFSSFQPRWEHCNWWDFNQARRLADLVGARYDGWVSAQFQRAQNEGVPELTPAELHGQQAISAFITGGGSALLTGGKRPFTGDGFNPSQPEHVLYVAGVTCEMIEVIRQVGDGRGISTDSVSSDDLWLSLASLNLSWLTPGKKAVSRDTRPGMAPPARPEMNPAAGYALT